ncbi:RDD family protein [Luteimonas fraxinea]|uniref:RDD family protein n=1 Tax=Luteimonas fraxinea TaxID=2901869 RepID=A0ABS8UIX5_9GAMM|nr:RDD family protein [Luteimonas fraxinea]MCD9098870.1 RDD family protein [Luteimonas fraxinea]MCD9125266.1 RDD family protein [Luteimonas fraxinea]UHH09072.1 RDD family protein [Luteimonas fraxinea]
MTEWYYADTTNTRQGPITTPALLQLRQQGTLGDGTLLWRDGLDGWTPLHALAHELGLADPSASPVAATTTADGWALEPVAPAATDAGMPAESVDDAWRPAGDARVPPAQPATASDAASPYSPPVAPVVRAAQVVHGGDVVDAGFLKRAAALFIDSLLVTAVYYAIVLAAIVLFGLGGTLGRLGSGTPDFGVAGIFLIAVIYLAWPLVSGLYYVLMESSARQATLGKMAVGIKVTGLDGGRISRGRAFARWASHLLAYVTLCIAYLVALFTERKQGLHDMVASTYVVDQWAYTDHPEHQQRTLGTVAIVILVLWAGLLLLGVGAVVLAGIAASL